MNGTFSGGDSPVRGEQLDAGSGLRQGFRAPSCGMGKPVKVDVI